MAEAAAVLAPEDEPTGAVEDTAGAPDPNPSPPDAPVGGGVVLLAKRFQVHYGEPLPHLNSPSAKAYRVTDKRDPEWDLFALVGTPGLPPRTNAMSTLQGDTLKGILPLTTWGVVDFPPLGQKVTVAVFQTPKGGRLTDFEGNIQIKVSEYDVIKKVIDPLTSAMQEMASAGLRCRAIRTSNLFFMDDAHERLVLGDFVTAPPGFDQPVLFEPIERAMADPAGRGHGEAGDDIYAMGITVACIAMGQNPLAGVEADEILRLKIERGTYSALCADTPVSAALVEPLRGMLSDDPDERWGMEELEHWLGGQKRTPMQRKLAILAKEPFSFLDKEYYTPRTLAHAFFRNPKEASTIIPSEDFTTWISTLPESKHIAGGIADLVAAAVPEEGAPPANPDMFVAKACIVMDPIAPLRYKEFSALPQGFGPAIALELLRKGNMQTSMEILSSDLPDLWFSSQPDYDPDASTAQKTFAQLKGFMKIGDPGYGPERILYEMNPTLPCQSPLLLNDFVVDIKALLPTLDGIANRSDPTSKPMDRHIAAFVTSRFSMDMTPHLKALADSDKQTSLIGMLSLLALLQWKLKPEPLYGLSSWIGGLMGPAINTYHSRATRRKIEQEIPKMVRKGSLPELFDLIDNAQRRKEDEIGFAEAQTRFATIDVEIDNLDGRTKSGKDNLQITGEKTAATASIFIAMMLGTVLFLAEVW